MFIDSASYKNVTNNICIFIYSVCYKLNQNICENNF